MADTHAESSSLEPGTYWIGDPCYAFDDDSVWMALLESADYTGPHRILEASAKGRMFTASGTAYGDGEFEDQDGNRYPVDAGLIGVTPAIPGQDVPRGMRKVTFAEPVTVAYEDGDIIINDITIETDPKQECESCGERIEYGYLCYWCESREEEDREDEEED